MRRTATVCGTLVIALSSGAWGQPQLEAELVAAVDFPTFLTHAPGDAERLFVLTKDGEILIIRDGAVQAQPFLDLTGVVESGGGEQGLLGLAFHPDYEANGLFYVSYIRDPDPTTVPNESVIARYEVTADPDVADPASAQTILVVDQPQRPHNGGWIGFGPLDGFLYAGFGDGGGSHDPADNGQNLDVLLGKLLRLDVDCDEFPDDPDRNYGIPPDNPFAGIAGAGEIWAWGLRNPWRCSFDAETGDLYIGDVGKDQREEVNFQPAGSTGGENYGWDCLEGTLCSGSPACDCADPDLMPPIFEYPHPGQQGPTAVIAGYVYRGCAVPELVGAFLVADRMGSQIWRLRHDGTQVTELVEIQDELGPLMRPTSFGVDARGELYICETFQTHEIYRIVPAGGVPAECACPWDIDGSGSVGINDFLGLLAAWGSDPGGPPDFDGDGNVGILDFLELLANWGPCP